MIHIIGIGIEGRISLTGRALRIIETSGLLVGGRRHLEEFSGSSAKKIPIGGSLEDVFSSIKEYIEGSGRGGKGVSVLATGDPSLYGIADFIIKKFGKKDVEIIPNVSTVQEAFARIKENSNGLKVLSGHGRRGIEGLIEEIAANEKLAVFTDTENSPSKIARALLERGVEGYTAYVCEALGTEKERITEGTLKAISLKQRFHPLNILVLIRDKGISSPVKGVKTGIPDELFLHSSGMITKEEIRVVSLSKLDIKKGSIVWDIGAGCGSVAVEAALIAREGRVYAVEKNKARVKYIEKNKRRFNTRNLEVITGVAPGCLKKMKLPAPDAVFAGGGGAGITGILDFVSERIKKGGRIVVNAVTIETAHHAFDFFKGMGWEREMALVNIAKAKSLGELNLLGAYNPVFIISGARP